MPTYLPQLEKDEELLENLFKELQKPTATFKSNCISISGARAKSSVNFVSMEIVLKVTNVSSPWIRILGPPPKLGPTFYCIHNSKPK